MRKLLWIGDAVVASGFARATKYTLESLAKTWDVHVLGLNYKGDPHTWPYPVYPCWPGGDLFGLGRTADLVKFIGPEMVLVQNDPWNIPAYMQRVGNVPVSAAVAVDGKNCQGRGLNGLTMAIFWTEFGRREAQLGGYLGPAAVVPLGVDRRVYYPMDRYEARVQLGLPMHRIDLRTAFIVGNVNRNQPRKRLDLSLMYFAEWIREYHVKDAYFMFHAAPTGDQGYDVVKLAEYLGIANRLIYSEPEIGFGVTEDGLRVTYNALDVQLSTTQGEGFGLTTLEGMACGIPQIAPDWSALGELFKDYAYLVPCDTVACTPNKINVIGGVPSRAATISALDELYSNKKTRDDYVARSITCASLPRYDWRDVGKKFGEALDEGLSLRGTVR